MTTGQHISRVLITVLLVSVAACSFSQKVDTLRRRSNGYAAVTFLAGFASSNNSFGGAMNFGVKASKKLRVGLGFELVKFKRLTSFYVPAYADFKYQLSSKGTETFFIAQPGYGFFKYRDDHFDSIPNPNPTTVVYSTIQQKGGFYFSTGLGVKLKHKPSPVLTLRYAFYQLKTTLETNGAANVFANKNLSNISSIVLNLGIAF